MDTSNATPDLDELDQLVRDVRRAILAIDAEPSRDRKMIFPCTWCEYASIVIAEVLRRRGLGDWTFITAGNPDGPNGHAWLELRESGGARLLTIDATIDQFPWGNGSPFVSEDQTPAAAKFTRPRYEGPWERWPVLQRDHTFRTYAEDFAALSGLA